MKQKLVVLLILMTLVNLSCEVDNTTSTTSDIQVSIDGNWQGECIFESVSDELEFYRKQTYSFQDGIAESVFTIYLVAGCDESQEQFRYDMLGTYTTTTTDDNSVDLNLFITGTTASYGALAITVLADDCPGEACFLPYPIGETPVVGEMYDNLSPVDSLPVPGITIFDIAKVEDGQLILGEKGDVIPRFEEDRPTTFDEDESFSSHESEAIETSSD